MPIQSVNPHYPSFSVHRTLLSVHDVAMAGPILLACDFAASLARLQRTQAETLGVPKVPAVSWEDIGGLAEAKKDILDTIQLPLQHPGAR